jgi:lipopolysaccharide export system protein LptA
MPSQYFPTNNKPASRAKRYALALRYCSFALLTCLWSTPGAAIESDRKAPIEIQADSAKISEAKQTAIYFGNVELVQGTLKIICDQLIVFNSPSGVERVEARGTPASYSQKMDPEKARVDAAAGRIIYLPAKSQIRLEDNAKIEQGGNIFEGQLIEYDLEKQVLMATGDTDNSEPGDAKQRVKMTLQPQKNSAEHGSNKAHNNSQLQPAQQ